MLWFFIGIYGLLITPVMVFVILKLHKTILKYKKYDMLYYLELLLNELTGPSVVTDNQGIIVYANRSFIAKSGYDYDELLGHQISKLKANLTTDYVASDLWKHLRAGQVWRGPFINQTKNGDVYTEEFVVFPMHDSLGDPYYCAIGHTIANRYLEEQAIQNIQRQSIRFKENFISNLSHEVRTPLNAMIGLSQLGQKGDHADRHISYFSKINVAARQLMQLMDDILDFSKIESGSFSLVKSRFNFMSLLTSLIGQYGAIAAEKKLEFNIYADEYTPQYIFSDAYRLEQILSNLLSNAMKYTEKGEVNLYISLKPNKTQGYVLELKVDDTGIGMSDDQVSGLFNPFSHLVSDQQRRLNNSSGLGMAITKQIVDLMNGRILITSRKNNGTSVEVSIPFDGQDLEMPLHDDLSAIEHLKVLVIDSKNSARENILHMLRGFQYEVLSASNGSEGIALMQAKPEIDLVLIDWELSDFAGEQAVLAINSIALDHTKLLYLSPYSPESLSEEARRVIHAYLPKPFTASMLFDSIANLFATKGLDHHITPIENGLFSGMSVLLVDDNPVNNLIAKNQFEAEGAKAVTFLKASKALEYMRMHSFDFIVSDIDMPEMNGFEFLKALRAQGYTLPVSALTANTSDQNRQDIMIAGFDIYMSKPLTHDKMKQLHDHLIAKGIKNSVKADGKDSTSFNEKSARELIQEADSSLRLLMESAKARRPKACKEELVKLQSLFIHHSPLLHFLEKASLDLQKYQFDAVVESVKKLLESQEV